uniref:Uncharacterized protein n=1 Tax=Anguilla anguilla TaxID=7936 RepID=A0A0E9TNF7_ANGAN
MGRSRSRVRGGVKKYCVPARVVIWR